MCDPLGDTARRPLRRLPVDAEAGARTPAPPPLATADGEHLLPVTRTSSPVDPDLFLDIFRLPVRQRLSIVINELGTGLAGSGAALRAAVHRADPAFLQLDRTLDILVQQRHALARLASASDRVLAPLARERDHIAGFVSTATTCSERSPTAAPRCARRSAACPRSWPSCGRR